MKTRLAKAIPTISAAEENLLKQKLRRKENELRDVKFNLQREVMVKATNELVEENTRDADDFADKSMLESISGTNDVKFEDYL